MPAGIGFRRSVLFLLAAAAVGAPPPAQLSVFPENPLLFGKGAQQRLVVVARYADAVCRRDEKSWAETWTEDGEWQIFGRPTHGRDAIVELWSRLMGGLAFVVQLPYGGIVSLDGDRGTGRWYISEQMRSANGDPGLMLGIYRDDYRREAGSWRFARRAIDVLYLGPPDLSAEPTPLPPDLGAPAARSAEES